jgi:hypothetical protein
MMEIRRPLIMAMTVLLLVPSTSVVVAQDESPAPDPAATLADSDFAGIFPTELGGLPWDDLTVNVGQQNLQDQDEEERAEFEALIESLGATIDDVTSVTATRISEDFTEFTFSFALRVAGVDADRVLERFVPLFAGNMGQPTQETGQVAGKDVLLLTLPPSQPEEEAQPFHFYASDDILWIVSAPEPQLTEAFEKLP